MAKSAKTVVHKRDVAQSQPASANVAGVGFKKDFSAREWRDINEKRLEMRERLFAAG